MSTIFPGNGHRAVNNRAWINEALHLQFNKKVQGKQISKQINKGGIFRQDITEKPMRIELISLDDVRY